MPLLISLLVLCLALPAFAPTYAATEQLEAGMVNPGYHTKPSWFKASFLDIREDIQAATDADKHLILYFYQDGCPYCARLLQDNFGNQTIAQKTQHYFDVIAINMWGDREVINFAGNAVTEKQFAESLRVQYTPTLLLLNQAGQVALRINGYFAPHKFSAALDYVAGKHAAQQDFRTFYAAANPQAASGKLPELAASLPNPLRLADNRANSYRPLLVMFEQKTCPDCDESHQNVLQHPLVAYALTNLDVAIVDVWSKDKIQTPDGREMAIHDWAKELKIQHAPSWVFFEHQGKEIFRTEAYLKRFHIHGAIDYVVTGAYQAQPNFQRFFTASYRYSTCAWICN